jgi:outer membrane protein OmpA-like peptidoglycan-associated protein
MYARWLLSYVLFFAIILTSCSSKSTDLGPPPKILDNYRYGDMYMQQVNYSINDKEIRKKEEALKKMGVQIVSVGQEYKLVVPADILFYPGSPRIQWKSYALLNDVIVYIQDFNKVNVKVAGVTRSTGNPAVDNALSINRARKVANYLWEQEIGAGILYIQGYVEMGQPDAVEISFRSVML